MKYLPLKAMILFRDLFEKKLQGYSCEIVDHTDYERIYILEDTFILAVTFYLDSFPVCCYPERSYADYIDNPYLGLPSRSEEYFDFVIEELTPNDIDFRFKRKEFISELEKTLGVSDIGFDISYTRFRGYHRLYWCPDTETTAERINRTMPDLQLRARYDAWTGWQYNYIIFEVDDIKGKLYYAVSYTKTSPQAYVNKLGNEFIKKGSFTNQNTRCEYGVNFDDALKSWKKVPRQRILEEHLKYFVIQQPMKEFDETWKYADKLLELVRKDVFLDYERFTYVHASNKWTTEERVFKIAKKLYKKYNVIYQHRPFYLKSSIGGQMSYDIYIAGLKVAIEYQGKQHFEPVEFFGGEAGLIDVQRRDLEKKEISKKNGVKLVYINYWEEVDEKLVKERVEQ